MKSITPRSERPMSRWISTPRPSCLPRLMSRALRSPVEAGSIAYSAVTQPRPFPSTHFGTDPVADAVQITRVSPCEISADPSAVRTKPGSTGTGRRSAGARSWERLAGMGASLSPNAGPLTPSLEADPSHGLPDLVHDCLGELQALLALESLHRSHHPHHQQRNQQD